MLTIVSYVAGIWLRSKCAAGKAVRAGLALGGRISESIRQPPIRVNIRACDLDCAGPLVVRENQSRRDLTKVAQYPAAAHARQHKVESETEGAHDFW
jgi:hypothetical protein